MHSQFNLKMRTCLFYLAKRIVVTPGIIGETMSSYGRPTLFGSRVLYEIGRLRHINKSHVLLTKIPKYFFCEGTS